MKPVPTDVPGRAPGWRIDEIDGREIVTLDGDWLGQTRAMPSFRPVSSQNAGTKASMGFDCAGLGRWDSGLIAFLWDAKRVAADAGRTLEPDGLPPTASRLLALLPETRSAPAPKPRRVFRPLFLLGDRTLSFLGGVGGGGVLFATVAAAAARLPTGRPRMRMIDLSTNIRDAGPSALAIVGVVNFLVGAILAFIGAVQLRKFAADAYVANLVGLAMVREMAAVMTGIVMAGRTGGAYAARIAAMRGNEEIDALVVIGIPVEEYIVLPAVLSLVITMPLLYLYGCLVGILGGFVVAIGMLDVTGVGFVNQVLGAVTFGEFAFGFSKTIVFALLIGITGCWIGLRAGRAAADVGAAATRAVVVGIVGIIAVDAIFAVIADVLGI